MISFSGYIQVLPLDFLFVPLPIIIIIELPPSSPSSFFNVSSLISPSLSSSELKCNYLFTFNHLILTLTSFCLIVNVLLKMFFFLLLIIFFFPSSMSQLFSQEIEKLIELVRYLVSICAAFCSVLYLSITT